MPYNPELGVVYFYSNMTFENYLIKISFEAILYKNIRIFYKDYLSNGVVEILEEPQIK